MELRQYWHLVRKWLWLVVLGTLLTGSIAFVVSRNMTPVYQASTTLLITPGGAQGLDNYTNLMASERLARTYAQLVVSPSILEQTYRRLAETTGAASTASGQPFGFSVSAEPVRDTQLLRISVTGTDPEWITLAANTVAQVFIEWQTTIRKSRYADAQDKLTTEMHQIEANIQELEAQIQELQAENTTGSEELARLQDQLTRYRSSYSALLNSYSSLTLSEASSGDTVTVVAEAVRPTAPIRPQVMRNTMLAAIVGAMLAIGVAYLVEYLDDTVKTPEDLRVADLNVVAAVQEVHLNSKGAGKEPFVLKEPKSLVAEAYRTLRTNLQFSSLDRPLRSLVVTSAVATEGKTTTVANLAVVIAQAGKRVVLVDADLRRPSAHKLFNLPNRDGLTTALVQEPGKLDGYLQDTPVENLRVLTSGPVPPNPQELLGSQRMEELIRQLEQDADIVLVDTPPSLMVADASVLAARTDGVLMVVNAGKTRRTAIEQAVDSLRQIGARVVGAVLNRVSMRGGRGYYYYYSYYSHYYSDEETDGRRNLIGRLRRWKPRSPRRELTESIPSDDWKKEE